MSEPDDAFVAHAEAPLTRPCDCCPGTADKLDIREDEAIAFRCRRCHRVTLVVPARQVVMAKLLCDLDRTDVDADRAAILAAELLVWWFQAGRVWYGRRRCQSDEGLRSFADEAVRVLGGFRGARRTLRSAGM